MGWAMWASAHAGKNQGETLEIFSRGLKTSWQQFVNESIIVSNLCSWYNGTFNVVNSSQYYADHLRSDEKWEEIWHHVIPRSSELDLDMSQLPESGDGPLEQSTTSTASISGHQDKVQGQLHCELIELDRLDRR